MASIEITKINDLRDCIRKCGEVRAVIRFGTNENWLKISKQTAYDVIWGIDKNQTPEDIEMYTDIFGTYDSNFNILYLG